jgi:hypothetical protein
LVVYGIGMYFLTYECEFVMKLNMLVSVVMQDENKQMYLN